LPELIPIGPLEMLHHWLEPVVGTGALRLAGGVEGPGLTHGTEWALIGLAVAIAVIGIVIAMARLKPAVLVPKRDAREEEGFQRTLVNKYYVDELYDKAIVRPTYVLS